MKNIMNNNTLISENPQSDIKYNNEAKRIFHKIKKNINNIKLEPTNPDLEFVYDTKGNKRPLYGVKFNLNQIDKKYNLNIIFAHQIGNNIAFFDRNNNRMVFLIISQTDKNSFENNEYYAKLRFKFWIAEDTFIHEFIHYLDSIRYKNTYKPTMNKNSKEEYYNSPEEFNAYMHGIITYALKNKYRLKNLPFKTFLNRIIKNYIKENFGFIKNINDDNKKKLIKRMYKTYTEFNKPILVKEENLNTNQNNILTEKEFNKIYVAQHKDIRGKMNNTLEQNKKSILKNGFHKSTSVNLLPIFNGYIFSIIDRKYGNHKDVITNTTLFVLISILFQKLSKIFHP